MIAQLAGLDIPQQLFELLVRRVCEQFFFGLGTQHVGKRVTQQPQSGQQHVRRRNHAMNETDKEFEVALKMLVDGCIQKHLQHQDRAS